MIRMIQSSSAGHAKAYFSDALIKSDYYLNDQELQGRFLGHLADRIGVAGMADRKKFFALCENVNPATGTSLTSKTHENRTVGYDINFHCPKSVSVIHALSKDDHLIKAFQESVNETMKDIEADSMTRVRKKGAYEDRKTGELVWAEFIHQTARPIDGATPDPHLHAHCFVFNATWDDTEKQIKAGQFRDINRDMPYYQARFHKKLSDKLIDLGYQVRRTGKSFEIAGVPQGAIDLFSKRTDEIGQFAKEHGITDAKQLSGIGTRTRAKKQKSLSMEELKADWKKQINELVRYEDGEQDALIRHAPKKEAEMMLAEDCVNHAVKDAFERASVAPDRRILEKAYRHSIGHRAVPMDEITDKFRTDKNIIHVKEKYRDYCTTPEVLAEEKRMVELARQGQGKFKPLYTEVPNFPKLNDQQNAAIAHVLTTSHQVSIIRGAAGTGKTTIMTEATQMMESAGKRVIIVAPTAEASRGVLASEGFKNATTVADLLTNKEKQDELFQQVLWVDEAGLLGTKDMASLLSLAKEQNSRLILGGDTRQHASVVRGDALRILNTVGGIKTAEISKIVRQKDVHYRAAVEDLSKGDVKNAFIKLSSIGAIKNVDPLKPNETLVADYIETVKAGKSALIVSPTHQQGEAVTGDLRSKLKTAGLLGKKELAVKKLGNLNLTEAQKSDWRNFEKGQIVQFSQNVPKIGRGSVWAVEDVSGTMVQLRNNDDETRTLPLDKATTFDVYRQTEITLAKGDKIRITKNGFDEDKTRLNNGQSLEVVSVSKSGKIELVNKVSKATYTLDRNFGHIDHAYCTTSHSAQGKTVDEVFISQPVATFTATNAKQFYVSVSRGRNSATIYTDDRVALLEYAEQIGDRTSAMELVGDRHLEYVQQQEREKYYSKNDIEPEKVTQPFLNRNDLSDYEPGL